MADIPDTLEGLAASFLEIGRLDWYVGRSYNRLHWVDLADGMTTERASLIYEYWSLPGPVKLACGRTAAWLHIPGIFTRMGAMRCTGCCRAAGFPQGKGSPKNDDVCRELLGLAPTEEAAVTLDAWLAEEDGGQPSG